MAWLVWHAPLAPIVGDVACRLTSSSLLKGWRSRIPAPVSRRSPVN
jgi:hypothetical protein